MSLCIVVLNAAKELERTFDSLDRQMMHLQKLGCELVVVDGESNDGSLELARGRATSLPGSIPTQLLTRPAQGIYPAMNVAWQQATAPWLLFLNAGDLLLDGGILAEAMNRAESVGAPSIQFRAAVFPPNWGLGIWMPCRPMTCHQALVYQRELHTQVGPYDERLKLCADTLMMQAIANLGQLEAPRLLSATEVSPNNASRDPCRIQTDLTTIERLQLPIDPWPRRRLTLFLLSLEHDLGFSLSVWLRLAMALLVGQAKVVRLG